jgi:Zn-dependent peptidase ImmA (M78 family)
MMAAERLVEVAEDLRRRSGQKEPAFSTQQIVSACFPGALVTGHSLPPSIDEAVSRTPDGIVILYRRGMSTAEQRYAIAHALGHLIFDGPEAACSVGSAGITECEARCDRFADELLAPLERLREFVTLVPPVGSDQEAVYLDQVDQIASHFHVPAGVIDRRIREL